MTDDATEQLIRATLARCVPDGELRRRIMASALIRQLLDDPEVARALDDVKGSTQEEVDAALQTALDRRGQYEPEG